MKQVAPRLVLMTPVLVDAEAFRPILEAALATGEVASVVLRLAAGDERGLVNRIKLLAPVAQARDAAFVVAFDGASREHDVATLAARGGADGVHVEDLGELRVLRERYRDERIVGTGRVATRHDAMSAGEIGADYVMFGDWAPDGRPPSLDDTIERASWWAEIFETPCVAVAARLADCAALAATGVEFVALAPEAWAAAADPGAAVAACLTAIEPRPGRAA